MIKNEVILVDEKDNQIGTGEKLKIHQEGKLHRAFSIFIFNSKGELLLQKRARLKYHSGGLWTNTCCSHPRPGESLEEATHRRLKEEMEIDCDLKEILNFIYKVKLGDLIEHEFNHVFFGKFNGNPRPDQREAEDWKWVKPGELKQDVKKNSENYAYWFKLVLDKVLNLKFVEEVE